MKFKLFEFRKAKIRAKKQNIAKSKYVFNILDFLNKSII